MGEDTEAAKCYEKAVSMRILQVEFCENDNFTGKTNLPD